MRASTSDERAIPRTRDCYQLKTRARDARDDNRVEVARFPASHQVEHDEETGEWFVTAPPGETEEEDAVAVKAEDAAAANAAATIKQLTTCGTTPDLTPADSLIKARRERNQCRDELIAARNAHNVLVAEHTHMERGAHTAYRAVTTAATALVVADVETQAASLAAVWCDIWARFDQLVGFSGHWTPTGRPQLTGDVVRLIQRIAAADSRQLVGGRNPAVESYRQQARSWFEALLTDPDAHANGKAADSNNKRQAA
jgi:hypothetical protein